MAASPTLVATLTQINGGVPGTVQQVLYDFDGDGIPKDDPLACWNSARQSLIGGNVQAALTQSSGSVVDRYRNLFLGVGTAAVGANMQAIGQVTPIYIDDDEARYYFTRTINGQVFSFVLTTVRENGLWKIRNF